MRRFPDVPRRSYSDLIAALRDPRGGVFFLSGDEHFLREEATRRVAEAHLDAATRDFNLDQLRGNEASSEALASLCATPPMMARWRVVVVREAQGLSTRARSVVESVAAAPPDELVLVISAAIPPGSSASFYRTLERLATTVQFAPLGPLDAPAWVVERAASTHGARMDAPAARALVAAVGPELGTLAAEVRKLVEAAAEPGRIAEEDVARVVGPVSRVNRWAWVELVGERRVDEAQRQLPALLAAGENGVGLVLAMGAHLLRIAVAVAGGEAALERAMGGRRGAVTRQVLGQAGRWTAPELETALTELLRTDRLLKTGVPSELQALDELLLRIRAIRGVAASAAAPYVQRGPLPQPL